MSLAFDENGRPYVIIRQQAQKKRLKGIDALKRNIMAARTVSNTLRTSLGPKGMDKMLVSQDSDVTVTNDGATILQKMDIMHPIARLMVDLSKSQDNQIGDGTTGVVVFAGALLEKSQQLLDKGLHPMRISDGFDRACDLACSKLDLIAKQVLFTKQDYQILVQAAMISLGSKVVSKQKQKLAEIAVKAVLSVADLQRRDVIFDLIKVEGKTGGSLQDTCLIDGILIDKQFSHPQMVKQVKDAKIAILTCPFQAPKPKTKHNIDITSAESYKKLHKIEQEYFTNMIQMIKKGGANIALCQWGFEDQANHLLLQHKLPAIRWVGGVDIQLIAMATGARIIPRFQQITPQKLGKAGSIKQLKLNTTNQTMIVIQQCSNAKAVTILVRGGSTMIVQQAKRALHDALCIVRNLIKCPKVICGGGASEIACSLHLQSAAGQISSIEQYSIRAFADALQLIPISLADNSGLNSISAVNQARAKQIQEKSSIYGIDCMNLGSINMQELKVFETLLSKKQQLQLATQVVKMILKIDDVIEPQAQ